MEEKTLDLTEFDDSVDITDNIFEKVEYFRKPGRIIPDQILKDAEGNKILVPSDGKRGKGQLKGVMVAYVPPGDDVVRIGFSMCHPSDQWDCIKGVCAPGLGKQIAADRADKWVIKNNYMTYKVLKQEMMEAALKGANLSTNDIKKNVIVPDTMFDSLCKFVQRCKQYYKDKRFPVWANNLPA